MSLISSNSIPSTVSLPQTTTSSSSSESDKVYRACRPPSPDPYSIYDPEDGESKSFFQRYKVVILFTCISVALIVIGVFFCPPLAIVPLGAIGLKLAISCFIFSGLSLLTALSSWPNNLQSEEDVSENPTLGKISS